MCRVSNALGVSEKHIQLLGESRALPSAPGTQTRIYPPCTGTRVCRAAVAWLSSVSFPPFLPYQWSPSEKVSLSTMLGACVCQPRLWREHATDGSHACLWPGEGALAASSSTACVAAPLPAKPQGKQRLCLHLFAAVSKLPACPQPVARRGHQVQLPAA